MTKYMIDETTDSANTYFNSLNCTEFGFARHGITEQMFNFIYTFSIYSAIL